MHEGIVIARSLEQFKPERPIDFSLLRDLAKVQMSVIFAWICPLNIVVIQWLCHIITPL